LILDDAGKRELDAMWADLDFVANATVRTYVQFYLSESGEGRKAGSEADAKEVTSTAAVAKLKEAYLTNAKPSGKQVALDANEQPFPALDSTFRWLEKARTDAEPYHLRALQDLAARAYRRALSDAEKADLVAYYKQLREKDGLDHEQAVRD